MIDKYNYNDEPSGRVNTLAMALDKCERLEKQLDIAKRVMNEVYKLIGYFEHKKVMKELEKAWERIEKLEELEK